MKEAIKSWIQFIAESFPALILIPLYLCGLWYFSRPHDTWPITFLVGVSLITTMFIKAIYDGENERKSLEKMLDDNNIPRDDPKGDDKGKSYIGIIIICLLLSTIHFFTSINMDVQQPADVEYKTSPYHK